MNQGVEDGLKEQLNRKYSIQMELDTTNELDRDSTIMEKVDDIKID